MQFKYTYISMVSFQPHTSVGPILVLTILNIVSFSGTTNLQILLKSLSEGKNIVSP